VTMRPRGTRGDAIETEGRLSAMEVQIEHLVEKTTQLSEKMDGMEGKIDDLTTMIQQNTLNRERRLGQMELLQSRVGALETNPSSPDELTVIYRKVMMAVYIALGLVFVMFVLTIFNHMTGIDVAHFLGDANPR